MCDTSWMGLVGVVSVACPVSIATHCTHVYRGLGAWLLTRTVFGNGLKIHPGCFCLGWLRPLSLRALARGLGDKQEPRSWVKPRLNPRGWIFRPRILSWDKKSTKVINFNCKTGLGWVRPSSLEKLGLRQLRLCQRVRMFSTELFWLWHQPTLMLVVVVLVGVVHRTEAEEEVVLDPPGTRNRWVTCRTPEPQPLRVVTLIT